MYLLNGDNRRYAINCFWGCIRCGVVTDSTSLAGRTWSQYLIESGVMNGESGRVSASGLPNTTGYRGRDVPTARVLQRGRHHFGEKAMKLDKAIGSVVVLRGYLQTRLSSYSTTMFLENGCVLVDSCVCCTSIG